MCPVMMHYAILPYLILVEKSAKHSFLALRIFLYCVDNKLFFDFYYGKGHTYCLGRTAITFVENV